MRIVTAAAVALALAGGAVSAATATATDHHPAVDGIWRMDGYGTVVSIRNGSFQEYQTTAVSCIEGDSARKLPNGMSAWLPNEEFLTGSGRTFDGTGIPPHLAEPVFTEEEFDKKRDSAFDRAVSVLRSHGGGRD